MVPPLLYVVSPEADKVNGWRFDANLWDASLPPAEAARRAGRPARSGVRTRCSKRPEDVEHLLRRVKVHDLDPPPRRDPRRRCAKVRFWREASTATQIRDGGSPPGEAIRGSSGSSTALDLEPTAQTDPQPTFMAWPAVGCVDQETAILICPLSR